MMRGNQRIRTTAFLTAAIGMWALGTVATPLYGQRNRPGGGPGAFGPGGPGPNARRLARELNLTDQQKSTVQGFRDNERSQLQALRNDNSLTREQKIGRMQEIQQQTRNSIRSILTTEQQMKLEGLQKQAEQRRSQMAGRGQLVKRLDLTDSQQTTIQSSLQEQQNQLKALRDNTSLSREQKRERMMDLRQQTQEKIRSTLTAEQQQKLDQLRQRAQGRFGNRGFGPRRGGRGQSQGPRRGQSL